MRKTWCVFWVTAVFISAAAVIGAILASRISAALCVVCVCLGAAALTFFYIKFRSVRYSVENGSIIIRGGVLIKSEQNIPMQNILWKTTVKFCFITLFTVIYTASGKAVIFAAADRELFPKL